MGVGGRGSAWRSPMSLCPGRDIAYTVACIASLTQQGCDRPVTPTAAKGATAGEGVAHVTISSCHPTTAKYTSLAPSLGIAECRLYMLSLPVFTCTPTRSTRGGLVEELVWQVGTQAGRCQQYIHLNISSEPHSSAEPTQ